MKILQIVISPPLINGKNSITGPERRAASLYSRFINDGFDVFVFYPLRGQLRNKFGDNNPRVFDLEIKNKFDIFFIIKLVRFILKYKIELVHSQGPASLDFLVTIACRLANCKSIVTRPVMINDQIHYSSLRRYIYNILDVNVTLKLADAIIAVSKNGLNSLSTSSKVIEEKLHLIYNGVDTHKFSLNDRINKENEVINIGMIAQLFRPKGWFDFIDSAELILKKTEKNIKFHIVGDGELKAEIIQYINNKGLQDRVVLTGFIDNVKVVLENLDIILFTTHREGFSVAILEAMSCGLPHITTKVGGVEEQINHGIEGFLVNVGDKEALSIHTLDLINNVELRRNMSIASRNKIVNNFSEDLMYNKHVELYNKILS